MANTEENDSGQYRITKKGNESAHRLLEGVPPSELGKDLAGAAIILYAFKRLLEDEVRQLEVAIKQFEDKLKTKRDTLKKIEDLMQTYWDASHLAGEWKGIGENKSNKAT